tara:strand:- start:116 stop:409 length:294 start_codon:yes stop_codon:yes gene_type:complete
MSVNRYNSSRKFEKGYETYRSPILPKGGADLFVFSREGDRLDLLANEFYGDARNWWIIADANNLGKGTLSVPPGLQLRIPREFGNMIELLDLEIEER